MNMRLPMASRIDGVKKIVVSSRNGRANYHVKVYYDSIESLAEVAKNRASKAIDARLSPYSILIVADAAVDLTSTTK